LAELEKGLLEELERLKKEPVPDPELQKIKNQIQTSFLRKLDSNSSLAYWLSYGQSLFGTWRYVTDRIQAYEKVSAEDVRRVAQKYFIPRNRTVATLGKPSENP
jgi:predicted Zn-dependent peptidase